MASDAPVPVTVPTGTGQRIEVLDIIRGLAVLGILLANITVFANPGLAYYWPPALPGGDTAADGAMWVAQLTLVDGKFRGLFTILFGAGLLLFVDRAGKANQVRRLLWLGLFGVLHFYLLFTGDILFFYAIAGLFALLATDWKAPQLLAAGVVSAVAGALIFGSALAPAALSEMAVRAGEAIPADWPIVQDDWALTLQEAKREAAAMTGDSWPALVNYRLVHEIDHWFAVLNWIIFETLPLTLIGMGMFRAGVFTNAGVRRACRTPAIIGVALGLVLNLAAALYTLDKGFPPYLTLAVFFGVNGVFNIPLLLGGAVLLTDWALAIRESWLGERLALAGRMAFSNYIGTSLVMALIFQGWAGGLYGTMHRLELFLVVLLGWALMITASRLWLARFRYGPLEYVWRCLTYWRLFPNKT